MLTNTDLSSLISSLKEEGLNNLSSYLNLEADDKLLQQSLQSKASGFEVKGQSIPIEIYPEYIIDLGSQSLNAQRFGAVVNLQNSTALVNFVKRKLGIEESNLCVAILFERIFDPERSKYLGMPVIKNNEILIVIQYTDEHQIKGYHIINSDGVRSVGIPKNLDFDLVKKAANEFDKMSLPSSESIRGLRNHLVVWDNKQWGTSEFLLQGNMFLPSKNDCGCGCSGIESVSTALLGKFKAGSLDKVLFKGMGSSYIQYIHDGGAFHIPGINRESEFIINFFNQSLDLDLSLIQRVASGSVTHTHLEQPSNSGVSGGGGGSASYGWGMCYAPYESRDNCYSCCDSQALGMVFSSGVATAGLVGAITGGLAGIAVGLALLLVAGVAAYTSSTQCKSGCNIPRSRPSQAMLS